MKAKMKKSIMALAIGGVLVATSTLYARAGELKAGAARVNITPEMDEFPFQAQWEKPYYGVHDDLFVRALVIDDGEQHRVAIVVVEATTIPQPKEALEAVAREAGISQSNVILAATHTHNSLMVSYHGGSPGPVHAREIGRIQKAIAEATRTAVKNLQPSRIAFGRGEAYVNINNGEEGKLKGWNDPKGSSDKTLDVIEVTSLKGEPIASLVNYGTHGEVMFRSVTKKDGYEVSGDLPGAVSKLLEGEKGLAPVVLFTSAAEGDQLPIFKSLQPAVNLDAADAGAGGWALLDVQARRLANAAIDVARSAPQEILQGKISTASTTITCPGKKRYVPLAQSSDPSIPPVEIPLSVISLGNFTLAGIGGDVAALLGEKIKAAAPDAHTTLITVTAGMVGYLLPDSSYAHDSHGVAGSPVKAGCAEHALVDGIRSLEESTR